MRPTSARSRQGSAESLLLVGGSPHQLHRELGSLPIAKERQFNCVSNTFLVHEADERVFAIDWLVVHRDDEVAANIELLITDQDHLARTAHAGRLGRRTSLHVLHEKAAARWQLQSICQISSDVNGLNTELGTFGDATSLVIAE